MPRRLIALALALVGTVACGKSAEEKAAEEQAKTVQQGAAAAQQGADQMAQGLQQMAQGLQQLAQGGAGGQTAAPVDFQKLETVLPVVSGWTRSEPEGHQMSMPVPISNTEATYTNGDMEVKLTIVDSAFSQIATAPLMMLTAAGYSEKTSTGYKRATTIGGAPAYEEWDSSDKSGKLGTIIGKRFMVEASGSNLDSVDTLKGFVQKVNAAKLAALK